MTSRPSGARRRSGFTLLEAVVVVLIIAAVASAVISMTGDVGDRARRDTTLASMVRIRDAAIGAHYTDTGAFPQSIADLLRRRTNPLPVVPDLPAGGTGYGWRGPYVLHSGALYVADPSRKFDPCYGPVGVGLPDAPALKDGWGHPIVLQFPNSTLSGPDAFGQYQLRGPEVSPGVYAPLDLAHARLVSAGPDGVLDTPHLDADVAPPATSARFPSRSQCNDDLVLYLRQADLRP